MVRYTAFKATTKEEFLETLKEIGVPEKLVKFLTNSKEVQHLIQIRVVGCNFFDYFTTHPRLLTLDVLDTFIEREKQGYETYLVNIEEMRYDFHVDRLFLRFLKLKLVQSQEMEECKE